MGKTDANEEKAKGSILEEDGKTTTAEPTKAKDTAGKGKSTGDEKKNKTDANKEKAKGSILEKDDKTTTAVPTKAATKDAKKGDDACKGESTGDEEKEDNN